MNKHWPIAFGVLGVVLGVMAASAANVKNAPDEEGIHYHAGFLVYVDNELQDFADLKYMKQDPCGDKHEVTDSPEEEQLEKAHLHDVNGDVVHVHREHATWADLFQNMDWEVPSDEIVTAYALAKGGMGGQGWTIYPENDMNDFGREFLESEIQIDQSVIFFFGDVADVPGKLEQAVTLDRIREVESLSEDCGKN